MSSDSSTLRRLLPFVQLTDDTLDEHADTLRDHGRKLDQQDRKLGAHDEAFGLLYKDLEALSLLMQTQLDAVKATMERIRARLNGH